MIWFSPSINDSIQLIQSFNHFNESIIQYINETHLEANSGATEPLRVIADAYNSRHDEDYFSKSNKISCSTNPSTAITEWDREVYLMR